MKRLYQYEGKTVRVVDVDDRAFTGIPVAFPADYGFHEFNRDEESIKLNDCSMKSAVKRRTEGPFAESEWRRIYGPERETHRAGGEV